MVRQPWSVFYVSLQNRRAYSKVFHLDSGTGWSNSHALATSPPPHITKKPLLLLILMRQFQRLRAMERAERTVMFLALHVYFPLKDLCTLLSPPFKKMNL